MTAKSKEEADDGGPKEFACLNCRSPGRYGMDRCSSCGTKYVWADVPECDEAIADQSGCGTYGEVAAPLFDQKSVECGYLDVERGVFAFTGPDCPNKYELSECQNCGTMLEISVRSCPLCSGATKKVNGGLVALVAGAAQRGMLDADPPGEMFCKSCGDFEPQREGRCSSCGGEPMPHSERMSGPAQRMIQVENAVFIHLNIETGKLEYLLDNGSIESGGVVDSGFKDIDSVTDIDTFGRIRMMFDEQTSTIIGLTANAPMTASEICRRLAIPRSVCYRKLKMLTDARLLSLCRGDAEPGDWQISRYLSNIETAYVALEHGEMNMLIKLKDGGETQTQKFSSEL